MFLTVPLVMSFSNLASSDIARKIPTKMATDTKLNKPTVIPHE